MAGGVGSLRRNLRPWSVSRNIRARRKDQEKAFTSEGKTSELREGCII